MFKIELIDDFKFQGNIYRTFSFYSISSITIRVFLYNTPANGYIYQVDTMALYFDNDVIVELKILAKQDILERRYEEYLKILENR
ncbi:hypothetical protein J7L48_06610 [bacterium]|nr:hypothetical protein [bacterium]